MKKFVLLFTLLLSTVGNSQIALTRHNGTPIADGQVLAFNSIAYPAAQLDFYVVNTSTTTSTNVKINCMSLVNNTGTGFELCFGNECLSDVEEGLSYPVNTPYVTLAPGASSGNDGHFLNTNLGTGVYPKDYTFRFYQAGNPSGNVVDVTYRFDPNLSLDEISQLETSGVILKSTVINNQLDLDVLKQTNIAIYDLSGKLLLNSKLEYGIQTIDFTNFSSGVYILNFVSNEGTITSNKKIIKN